MAGQKTTTSASPAVGFTTRRKRQWLEPPVGLIVMVAELSAMWLFHVAATDARAAFVVADHLSATYADQHLDYQQRDRAPEQTAVTLAAAQAMTRHAGISLTQLTGLGASTADAGRALLGLDAAVAGDRGALRPTGPTGARGAGGPDTGRALDAWGAAVTDLRAQAASRARRTELQVRLGFVLVMSLATVFWILLFRRFLHDRQLAEYQAGEERALRRSERRFRSLIDNASDLVTVVSPDTTIGYQTPSSRQVLGREPDAMVGQRLLDLLHPDDTAAAASYLEEAFAHPGETQRVEWRLRHNDGRWVLVEALARNLTDDASINGVVLTMRDVMERKALEEALSYQALHDPLTGLANRVLFTDRLRHALARRERNDSVLAVLLVDMDDFKTVNESLGHFAGDQVLTTVAARLQLYLREGDSVARFSGDEFGVLLEDVDDTEEVMRIAERLSTALAEPTTVDDKEVALRASLGIAIHSHELAAADELLRGAGVAMSIAKRGERGGFQLYRPEMYAAAMARLELRSDLGRALERGEFEIHYQPTVVLATGSVHGLEALVRWRHPHRGLIAPLDFIPLAEESGLIIPIGRWILAAACRQAHEWHRRYPTLPALTMSINLSAVQLADPDLVGEVAETLAATHVDPRTIVLEITESTLLDRSEAGINRLRALRALGLHLAIDDFGTGYSSLSYLRELPVDILKIDKSFVDGLLHDGEAIAVASTIIELGRTLRLDTVAEGIEEPQQAGRLLQLACRLGQGYLFARPLNPAAAEEFLDAAVREQRLVSASAV
ncbi:MAG: EAL domain-containing protein [Actinomycetota bacterium]|nr:EAL domain-containing protein [Actinomycetota bacterium]